MKLNWMEYIKGLQGPQSWSLITGQCQPLTSSIHMMLLFPSVGDKTSKIFTTEGCHFCFRVDELKQLQEIRHTMKHEKVTFLPFC